jgi:general secretion pathway protein A
LEALLRHRRLHGEMSLLIVDEAQSLPLELLEEIRLLANIESDDDKLLSVILAGQPELAFRLNNQELRQLKQRVALRCELRALTFTETMTYLDGRIRAAGGGGATEVFTRQAVELIHSRSHGIPRTVNVISDNALLGGFAAGEKPVSAQTIREVCRDFDLTDIPDGFSAVPEPAGMATPPWAPSPVALPLRAAEPRTAAAAATAEPERDRRAAQSMFGEFASKQRKRFSFFRN